VNFREPESGQLGAFSKVTEIAFGAGKEAGIRTIFAIPPALPQGILRK
jgi:hypothetical protein